MANDQMIPSLLDDRHIIVATFDGRGITTEHYENENDPLFIEDLETWKKCGLEIKVYRFSGKAEDYVPPK